MEKSAKKIFCGFFYAKIKYIVLFKCQNPNILYVVKNVEKNGHFLAFFRVEIILKICYYNKYRKK